VSHFSFAEAVQCARQVYGEAGPTTQIQNFPFQDFSQYGICQNTTVIALSASSAQNCFTNTGHTGRPGTCTPCYPYTNCYGTCVDTYNDWNNCGWCGNRCSSNQHYCCNMNACQSYASNC
jgi:hypothetical protein